MVEVRGGPGRADPAVPGLRRYRRLSVAAVRHTLRVVVDDPTLVAVMQVAPEEQHNPVLLFVAVHDLLLRGLGPDLAAFYPNLATEPQSTVHLTCGTRGNPPIPATMPTVAATSGLDVSPIDVHDADQTRWLEACVWPDQSDRFARLRASLEIARQREYGDELAFAMWSDWPSAIRTATGTVTPSGSPAARPVDCLREADPRTNQRFSWWRHAVVTDVRPSSRA